MRTLSTGQDSTLGNYLMLTRSLFGEDSPAVRFLQGKIDSSPNGADEEVIADEAQALHMLARVHTGGTSHDER